MMRFGVVVCVVVSLFAADSASGQLRGRLGERLRAQLSGGEEASKSNQGSVELKFGTHAKQTLDYWKPKHAGSPLVIFVHGGAWRWGDKANSIGVKDDHYVKQGYAVASLNYRLVPDHKVEDSAADIARAIAYLVKNATRLNFDPKKIVLMGHSAGAHLAALVGTDPTYLKQVGLGTSAVRGVIPIDGAAYHVPNQIAMSGRFMKRLYDDAFGRSEVRQKKLSPVIHAASSANVSNFLILHVQRAEAVKQSAELGTALKKRGTNVVVRGFQGDGLQGHAEINKRLGDETYPATAVVDQWLEARFGR